MEISDIKSKLSLSDVLNYYHLKPDKHLRLHCPFHNDKTPSLQVYWKTGTVYCFSSNCKTHGKSLDVIDFIMYKENCTKHEAIKKAEQMINGETKPGAELTRAAVLTKMFTYFKNAIYNSKPVQEYLQQRNLDYQKTEVGYNSGQFHHGNRKDQHLIESCLKYGLLQDKGHVNNRTGEKAYSPFGKWGVVFPLRNQQNQIVSLYFRSTKNEDKAKHYYLKDRQGLYPKYPAPNTKKLILTEAIIDAATLLQQEQITKEHEILSLYGTNGLTEEHIKAIRELEQLEEVILFFDGDAAGEKAAEKYSAELHQLKPNITISKVPTPEKEDINSLLDGHSPEILAQLIEDRTAFVFSNGETSNEVESLDTQIKPVEKEKEEVPKLNTNNPERISYQDNQMTVTVWGGIEKENLSRLRVSLHIKNKENRYKTFRDDVNLYSHSAVKKLVQNASETLELPTTQIEKTITELTEQLEAYRMEERALQIQALKPKQYEMTPEEVRAAQAFLKEKKLVKKTLNQIQQSGLVGEQKNGLMLFFLYLSRLTDEPLHAIIFGKSGSGKTYLQKRISECLPEESVRTITSLTENTLYYSAKGFWQHKLLLIEDLEGVYQAFLPLREFMSNQSISKLTTDKDAKGNNVQKVLTVEGPICVSGATTKESIYEDNANRSFLLHIDESPGHLDKVMEYQRKTKAGMINEKQQEQAKQILKNTQRLLQNIKVINPYAMELRIPELVFKKLRTNMHYLKLIEIITFYHQAQRQVKKSSTGTAYIETTLSDIETANWLVKESLLRKSDELNGELRQFFERLKSTVAEGQSFYNKQIREAFRMNRMQVNRYLRNLEGMGYLEQKGGNRKQGFEYQVCSYAEYEQLKAGIDVLDENLNKIKAKCNGKKTEEIKCNTSVTEV